MYGVMTRAEHYREAMRLHEEASPCRDSGELHGWELMLSALFHATMAANPDLATLSREPPRDDEPCPDCTGIGFHADGCRFRAG